MESIYTNKYIEKAENINDRFTKMLYVTGIITCELEKFNLKPVIIGGCAVEFYTFGGYNTFDIDIALQENENYSNIMIQLGFTKEGRFWIHKKLGLMLEATTSSLAGEEAEIVKVELDDDLYVYFIGIEDLIIDRLNGYVHWKYEDDLRWSKRLIVLHKKELNIEYLKRKAKENESLEALLEIINESDEL